MAFLSQKSISSIAFETFPLTSDVLCQETKMVFHREVQIKLRRIRVHTSSMTAFATEFSVSKRDGIS